MTEQFQCQVVEHMIEGVLCLPAGITAVLMFIVHRTEDVQANLYCADQGSTLVLCLDWQEWMAYSIEPPQRACSCDALHTGSNGS